MGMGAPDKRHAELLAWNECRLKTSARMNESPDTPVSCAYFARKGVDKLEILGGAWKRAAFWVWER